MRGMFLIFVTGLGRVPLRLPTAGHRSGQVYKAMPFLTQTLAFRSVPAPSIVLVST